MKKLAEFDFSLSNLNAYNLLGDLGRRPVSREIDVILTDIAALSLQQLKPVAVYMNYPLAIFQKYVEEFVSDEAGQSTVLESVKGCSEVVLCIMTIGPEIEKSSLVAFEAGDPLKGMVLDALGNWALLQMQKQFWQRFISKATQVQMGLIGPFSPGVGDWPLSTQELVFKLCGGAQSGCSISDGGMLIPVKSITQLYGLGADLPLQEKFDLCKDCSATACHLRETGKCHDDEHLLCLHYTGREPLEITVARGENLLEFLRRMGLPLNAPCSGQGTCGKCKVKVVVKGENCLSITSTEKRQLSQKELDEGYHLACCVKVNQGMDIHIPEEGHIAYGPVVQSGKISQFNDLLGETTPALGLYGLAIDLGTTTVVAYILDLATGRELGHVVRLNPQRQYGSDVVSRIHYMETAADGLTNLQNLIIECFNELAGELAHRHGLQRSDLRELVVVGNTVMVHILLGKSCASLGQAPYTPEFTGYFLGKAQDLGLELSPDAAIYIPPGLAGYVGADITAGILASDLAESDDYALLLDIGTNGEMVLGSRAQIFTCATAAGPAFEGAGIRCGMGAVAGAISAIQLDAVPPYTTIGGVEPRGMCGSGVLDGVALLLRKGIIDPTGRMHPEHPLVSEWEGNPAFVVVDGDAPILLTQQDIRQIQLAKGAIRAGIEVLMRRAGISAEQVKHVYLAGGFGNYLRIASAEAIGLIPRGLISKITPLGNSAGTGAKLLLTNLANREKVGRIPVEVEYIELATAADFQDLFIEHMHFPEQEN